jgi:23S rRNA (uracil1939-C5)-methyltransferase
MDSAEGHRHQLDLVATGMASNGQAIGRDSDGKVVFVEGALPGELVRVEILSERPSYSSGRVTEVLAPAELRQAPPCPEVARGCGACQWQHATVAAQHQLKSGLISDAIQRLGRVESPEVQPTIELAPWRYRTTLRAGVVDGQAGLRQIRSHRIVTAENCLVVHPLLAELLVGPRFTGAREVVLRCGARTKERLVSTKPSAVKVRAPADVRRDHIHEFAAGRLWRISARSFFQTRADGVDALAALVAGAADQLGAASTAIDLYSGVGVFAGVLAARGWSVTAVEGAASAVDDARVNLQDLGVAVVRADVTRWTPARADLVVADPSRAGLGPGGTGVIAASGARRLVLVSCDAGSLGRDIALLRAAGYGLTSVTPVDLFPHTFHVEVVSIFDRCP